MKSTGMAFNAVSLCRQQDKYGQTYDAYTFVSDRIREAKF